MAKGKAIGVMIIVAIIDVAVAAWHDGLFRVHQHFIQQLLSGAQSVRSSL